jgi:hypothetical protein
MRKFLFILLISLFSFLKSDAQQYRTVMYKNWVLVGTPSWTTPSFYYCVTRSAYQINGYWRFDVYFTSNTYTWDYYNNRSQWRYVQMEGCKVYWDGQMGNYGHTTSFSFIKDYAPPALSWATKNATPTFKIYWNRYYTL